MDGVHALRWFARGRVLGRDPLSDDTFLIEGAIPGEVVDVDLHQRAHDRVARVVRVRGAAPGRIEPVCRHASRCTGCGLLHVREDVEDAYKRLVVREVLERYAGIVVADEVVECVGTARRGGHRVRARFTVTPDGDTLRVGLRDHLSQTVSIPDCHASSDAVREVMLAFQGGAEFAALVGAETSMEVLEGVGGVAVVMDGPLPSALVDALRRLPAVVAVGERVGERVVLRAGSWPAQLPVGDLALTAALDAWTQPCPRNAAELYAWVAASTPHRGQRILDATCGTGGLSLLLARGAAQVVGVDANIDAVRSAAASAASLGQTNVTFRGGKIETVAPRLVRDGATFDGVVINPMRRSIGAQTMAAIAALGPRWILYLGPAPRAAADDIAALVQIGFVVARVAAINLHPGTAQVMCGVLLTRADAAP